VSRPAPATPGLAAVPCAAMWFDPRAVGRPLYEPVHMRLTGHHDGWRACGSAGTDLVEIDGTPRLVCPDHARQTRAVAAAGLAAKLRWRP
jgi:hypothetical protein